MTRCTKGKELKKEITTKLGIKPSLISVRYDGSYRIDIKDWAINKEAVEEIAKTKQSIRRCEYTHEILCGGNTFVFVNYSLSEPREACVEAMKEEVAKWNFDERNSTHNREYHLLNAISKKGFSRAESRQALYENYELWAK